MKTVDVYFQGYSNTSYAYMVPDDVELKEYDYVTVLGGGSTFPSVAKVVKIPSVNPKKATKWIIQKVDMSEYNRRIESEKRRNQIKMELDARMRALDVEDRYARLASIDPEAARLINELKGL